MSYGSGSSSSSCAHVQGQLESLLERLSWSYVALWSFDNQSRRLVWTGGHFRGNVSAGTRRGDAEIWIEQLFSFTYKACTFSPGLGSVGMAHAENKCIWKNGASAQRSSGSKEQAPFLQHASIETVVCIPCAQSVLELGTCENVVEDVNMIDNISVFMWENILPALARAGAPQSPLAATFMMVQSSPVSLLRHASKTFLSHDFELNLLTEQIRRTSSLNSSDVLLPQPEEGEGREPARGNTKSTGLNTSNNIAPKEPRWRSSSTTTRTGSAEMTNYLQAQMQSPLPAAVDAGPDNSNINNHHPGAALMSTRWFFPYASISPHSGTTSSSVSSLEESSALVLSVVDSPEQSVSLMASAGQLQSRRDSHSFTSSSARRETPAHSPDLQPCDSAISTPALAPLQNLHYIQQAISHMLDEPAPLDKAQEQWPQLYTSDPCLVTCTAENYSAHETNLLNSGEAVPHMGPFQAHEPEEELNQLQAVSSVGLWPDQPPPAFTEWRRTQHGLQLQQKMKGKSTKPHQFLLRRSFEMMRRMQAQLLRGDGVKEARVISISGPKTIPEHDPLDQAGTSTAQRRSRGGPRNQAITGPVHAGHDEAAQMHMMSERRRRLKQTENFIALRKLVPIISKNDKASILGDAIVYLRDLQAQIQELEARKAQMESQYEGLKLSHEQLERRNKELEAMVAARSP